jgi:hypothetical protein
MSLAWPGLAWEGGFRAHDRAGESAVIGGGVGLERGGVCLVELGVERLVVDLGFGRIVRFIKRGADYTSKPGIKWMSSSTKRQCD